MRFLATADWQLGMTAHYLNDEARARFQQARLDAVRRIGQLADAEGAGFVVVCGDVFESNQLDRRIVSRTFEVLKSFTVPVVLVPGNHDPLDASSLYNSAMFTDRCPSGVIVVRDDEPFEVIPGVELVGVPWYSKRPLTDLVAAACAPLEAVLPGRVRVIAGHGAVSDLNPDRDSAATIDVAGLRSVLASGRAQVAVLGDRHGTFQVADAIWYPGTPEVTARREVDPGNVLVIDVDEHDRSVTVTTHHTGRWSFTTLEDQLNSPEDVEAFAGRLAAVPDKERTAVWLVLTGTLTIAAHARLEEVLQEAAELFAHLEFWQRHTDLAVLPDDHDFAELDLGGFAQDAVNELTVTATAGGEDAPVAQDALGLLYRLMGSAR